MSARANALFGGLLAGSAAWEVGSGILHGGWVRFVLAAMMGVMSWVVVTWPSPEPAVEPDPSLVLIKPVDQDDSFCTCPKCHLLGNHAVEIRHHAGLRRVQHGDDWVEIGTWASPSPGPYAHRTCWFCGHEWRTSAA